MMTSVRTALRFAGAKHRATVWRPDVVQRAVRSHMDRGALIVVEAIRGGPSPTLARARADVQCTMFLQTDAVSVPDGAEPAVDEREPRRAVASLGEVGNSLSRIPVRLPSWVRAPGPRARRDHAPADVVYVQTPVALARIEGKRLSPIDKGGEQWNL